MTLNLHLLRIFHTVATSENFSRAAEALYISQPAISQAIQTLEREVGIPLVVRMGRTIHLTDAGGLLHDYTKQIFATEHAAEMALQQFRGLERGQLAIGASSTIGVYLLPSLLSSFHELYPGIRLLLEVGTTPQIAERLLAAVLDTAFVEAPVTHRYIEATHWRDDTLVVIASARHPLAHQSQVKLPRLMEEAFIVREPGSRTREIIDNVLQILNVKQKVALELGSTEAIKQAVMAGLGVAIVSVETIAAEIALGRLAIIKVPELTIRRQLNQLKVTGRPTSPALTAFQVLVDEVS